MAFQLRRLHAGVCHPQVARGRFPSTDAETHSSVWCSQDSIRQEGKADSVHRAAPRFASDAAATCSIRFLLLRVSAPRVMWARSLLPYSLLSRRLRGLRLEK